MQGLRKRCCSRIMLNALGFLSTRAALTVIGTPIPPSRGAQRPVYIALSFRRVRAHVRVRKGVFYRLAENESEAHRRCPRLKWTPLNTPQWGQLFVATPWLETHQSCLVCIKLNCGATVFPAEFRQGFTTHVVPVDAPDVQDFTDWGH